MGELHLEVIVDRLLREFKVDANVGRPQVAYRETVRQPVEKIQGRFVRQTGGRGQYGHAVINLEPAPGRGLRLRQQDQGRRRSRRSSSPPSSRASRRRSSPASRPATRWWTCASRSTDGSFHDVDSSEMAFKIAGSMALREAARRAKPVLLEPIMAVEVVTPEEFMGDVIGDLNRRRGPDRGHGAARQRPGDPGLRAAGRDVRLRHRPALADAGPGDLHDAVRPLRARSPRRCPRRSPSTAAAPPWAQAPSEPPRPRP